nr:hypothetical protein [Cytophagales bacterium]
MKTLKISVLLIVLVAAFSCDDDVETDTSGNAEVVISVASRGVYQFLIIFNGTLYYPENLPEEFKVVSQEPILVHIRFQRQDYQEAIFEPAPNDVPVFLKTLPVIRLISIEKI